MNNKEYNKLLEDTIIKGISLIRINDMVMNSNGNRLNKIKEFKKILTEFFNLLSTINNSNLSKGKKQLLINCYSIIQDQINNDPFTENMNIEERNDLPITIDWWYIKNKTWRN